MEHLISLETNPLASRRNLISALVEHVGQTIDPDLAKCARDLLRSDSFWLGLHSAELPRGIVSLVSNGARAKQLEQGALQTFVEVFASLADEKGEHTDAHGPRTAECAAIIGAALGYNEERCALLRLAGLAHDIGLLAVPSKVIAKPDILSLSEMETMRKHPTYGQMVMEAVPGLEGAARWIGAHHERPDGKGYPELLEGGEIPIEGQIIALADTYVALTSERPYRRRLEHEEALRVLAGGAGTQLNQELVQLFCALDLGATSSRSVRRSARTR
jgi:HD-GYP domain-containing protein (c-di-GMP phosphodiesterase class II)